MTDNCNSSEEKQHFNVLSFERKCVEMVEELRLRRKLEEDSEKNLVSVMEEKYQQELSWDEQIRRFGRERESLEQQVELLKRKLEDKVCVSDEDKAKQQVMNKTYSREIRMLKEELRVSKSEKIALQKKNQELEGKLKLHDTFQESILNQVSDVRNLMKAVLDGGKELAAKQHDVMENVASAKLTFNKFDLFNQHLQQCIVVIRRKSEALKAELIDSRSEISLLKQSLPARQENNAHAAELEKLRDKVLNLENLLLLSRKENEKTLCSMVESNKLLCTFMDKFSDVQQQEKRLAAEHDSLKEKMRESEKELHRTRDEMREIEQRAVQKERERIEKQRCAEVQTENTYHQNCFCLKPSAQTNDALSSLELEAMDTNFMDGLKNVGLADLQKNALVMQSGVSLNNGISSFSLDQLCVNSADKKITLSQVLKRKLEIVKSGSEMEWITMKRRFSEDAAQSVIVVEEGIENKMLAPSYQPPCNNSNTNTSVSPIKNKKSIFHGINDKPLHSHSASDVSGDLPQGIRNEMVASYKTSDPPSCDVISDAPVKSPSDLKNKMIISDRASDHPSCNLIRDASVVALSDLKNKMGISDRASDRPSSNVIPDAPVKSHSDLKSKMVISDKASDQPSCNLIPEASLKAPSDLENKIVISDKVSGEPLCNDSNFAAPLDLSLGLKSETLLRHDVGDKPFCCLNLDASTKSPSDVRDSHKSSEQPLPKLSNSAISKRPLLADIWSILQKPFEKLNEDDDN